MDRRRSPSTGRGAYLGQHGAHCRAFRMMKINKLIDKLVDIWLQSCAHEDVNIAADILEGGEGIEVKYCRRCGAVRPAYHSEWRRPRPLWFPKGAQTQ